MGRVVGGEGVGGVEEVSERECGGEESESVVGR